MKYYEHHLGDYLRDTMHLSILEDGAYRRLIDAYYNREAPIPKSLPVVFRLIRAENKAEKAAVEAVLKEFFVKEDDGWHHIRCDEEIGRYNAKRTKAQGSANARWNAMRTHSDGNALQSPISNPQEEEKNPEDKIVLSDPSNRIRELGVAVRQAAAGMKTKESP